MENKKRIKYYSTKAEEVEDRVLRFIGSTEDIDRDNEVIKASGWKIKNYKKNPVVLVGHNSSELPVAKTKDVWVDKEKSALMFDIEFPESDISPQGDTLYKLYKNSYMNATSVGFMPNMEKAIFGKTKADPSITFTDQELLEISLVSVPANPRALITSKSMKQAVKDDVVDKIELADLEIFLQKIIKEEIQEPEEKEDIQPVDKKQDVDIKSIIIKLLENDNDIKSKIKNITSEKENINRSDEDGFEEFCKQLYGSILFKE